MPVVGKRDTRSDKHVIFDGDTRPNADSVLNGDIVTDDGPAFNKCMVANVNVATYFRASENMCVGPDSGSRTNL